MASYDRRILVPYLRDVCSLEMLCRKLERDTRCAKAEADKYAGWANAKYEDPKAPDWDHYKVDNSDLVGGIVCCVVFGGGGLLLMFIPPIGLLGIAIGIFMLWSGYTDYKEHEARAEKSYEEAIEKYRKTCATQKANRQKRYAWLETSRQWRSKQNELTGKLNAARKLRNDVYSVNIIPTRYRNIHSAYFLYDYFESGRETDLDKIIQTMLLDEIVQRLDKIIAQNQEIIINQRMQLARQEQRNKDDDNNHQKQMKHIAQMEQNQQRQIDYQNMIVRNQQVTNFFLAADYLRKR